MSLPQNAVSDPIETRKVPRASASLGYTPMRLRPLGVETGGTSTAKQPLGPSSEPTRFVA
jgi:hypothetical protein